jgi:hypothetical protein
VAAFPAAAGCVALHLKLLLLLMCHAAADVILLGCCCCLQDCLMLQLLLQSAVGQALTMPHPKCPCQQGVRSSPQHCTPKADEDNMNCHQSIQRDGKLVKC